MIKYIWFIFLGYTLLFSQNMNIADSDSVYQGPAINVTAARLDQNPLNAPFAVSSIDQEKIQQGQAGVSLQESLLPVAGIFVNNRQNFALGDRISIRGIGARSSFGVRGIKIILDGIPLTMADGQSQLNNLDLFSTGKMEVIKGPGSALYGNAAGGVILLESQEPPENQKLKIGPQVLAGSYGLFSARAKLSASMDKMSYLVSADYYKADGFRDHAFSEKRLFNAVVNHSFSENLAITTVLNWADTPYAYNPSSLSKSAWQSNPAQSRYFVRKQAAGEKSSQTQGGVTLHYKPDQKQELSVTVYGIGRSLFNPIPDRIIKLNRLAGGLRSVYSRKLDFPEWHFKWTAGLDMEIQADDRREYENNGLPADLVDSFDNAKMFDKVQAGNKLLDQDETVSGIGPFVQLEIPYKDNWLFTLAGRYDTYGFKVKDHFLADTSDDGGDFSMKQFSPLFGIVYKLNPLNSLYVHYSTAFQTPTTSELSNRPDGSGGLNTGLKPERVQNVELGIRGFVSPRLYYTLSVYHMLFRDLLISYQNPGSEQTFFRNAGVAKNSGLEVSVNWQIGEDLSSTFMYNRLNFVFTDYILNATDLKNNKVPGVSPNRFYSPLTYENSAGFYIKTELNFTGQYYVNDYNGPVPGSTSPKDNFINDSNYFINLKAGKTFSWSKNDYTIFIGINNLSNQKYCDSVVPNAFGENFFEPAPGRNWYAGLKVSFL